MGTVVRPAHCILSDKPNQQALASSESEIRCECMPCTWKTNIQLCLVVCSQCVRPFPQLLPKAACPRHSPLAASCLHAPICRMNVQQEVIDTHSVCQSMQTQQMHLCTMISAACRSFCTSLGYATSQICGAVWSTACACQVLQWSCAASPWLLALSVPALQQWQLSDLPPPASARS